MMAAWSVVAMRFEVTIVVVGIVLMLAGLSAEKKWPQNYWPIVLSGYSWALTIMTLTAVFITFIWGVNP